MYDSLSEESESYINKLVHLYQVRRLETFRLTHFAIEVVVDTV
jgi:hypothetical protein